MSVKVKDKDRGYRKLMHELAGGEITLGIIDKAELPHPSSDLTIGELAAIHELGIGVPERSWLRSWIDGNRAYIESSSAQAWQQIATGKLSRKDALDRLGRDWANQIQENILQGNIIPPLAASTVASKGHSVPLIDTMTLIEAIDYELKLKNIKSIRDAGVREVVRRNQRR